MKILVIRFSSIGDIVLTTPVVRCLHEQIGAEVHYLTKANFASILAPNPHIGKVISFRRDLGEVLPLLRKENYDAIVDLHQNLRSWRVRRALWRTTSYGFDKINFRKWLMVNLKINILPDIHIVDRYLIAAQKLGIVNDGKGLDYFVPPENQIDIETLSAQNPTWKRLPNEPFVAVVIGAAHATKRLPEHKIVELCRQITQPIVLLGGPDDAEAGAKIAATVGAIVLNLCGVLRLHESASVVGQAQTVVTHDTGMMHIAAALHRDIVSIWGNTVPEFGMTPYFPTVVSAVSKVVEVKGLGCRPCSKIGFGACPKGHFRCMEAIDFQDVRPIVNNGGL